MSLTLSKTLRSSSSASSRLRGCSFSTGIVLASCSSSWRCSFVSFFGVDDVHGDVQVAAAAPGDARHPLAAQPEDVAALRALRHRERLVAVERRHLHLAAERGDREGDRAPGRTGRRRRAGRPSVPARGRRRRGRPAGRRRCRPRPRRSRRSRWPVAMPAGIFTVSLRCRAITPLPVALGARLGDDAPGAAALAAGLRDGEEALLVADLAAAAALRADGRRAARARRPMPRHVSHGSWRGIWMVVSMPVRRLLERDLEVVAQVGAALRAAAPRRRRRCRRSRRCRAGRRRCRRSRRRSSGRSRRARRRADARVAEAVVGRALLARRRARRRPRPPP